MADKKRLIFDCDPGVDDALALILALNSDRVDLGGITTVSGNVSVDQTTRNACRLLDYFDVDIPVAKGASRPLKVAPVHSERVHGSDGLGDSPLLPPDSPRKLEPGGAVEFILRSVGSGVGTIVATGPLTNIALAFQKDREVMGGVRELVMMGGAIHVPGNMDSLSEFNFYVDPDAADYVLQEATVPKVLVPLDVTRKVLLTPADVAGLGETRSGRLIRSIVPKYHSGYIGTGLPGGPLHDPLAMGFCIEQDFLDLRPLFVRVETTGVYTRGACVPEERPWVQRPPNVEVALGVDSERFLDYFKRTASE
ncbi:MAG: nucleoside hydrolase [Thaumarchaeota archaeon]|nr:nucleoside hydrolase [Nitrososphaerota archaeon]